MRIKTNEFRTDASQPVEAPLDFQTLCKLLAASQAETPTARLARGERTALDHIDHGNPAVAVLLAVPGHDTGADATSGSFHAAAAACFNQGSG